MLRGAALILGELDAYRSFGGQPAFRLPPKPTSSLSSAKLDRTMSHPLSRIQPPLVNSSNPWATSYADLLSLYDCPYTGAVTTRTSMLHGFVNDPAIHQHTFFRVSDIDACSQPPPDSAENSGRTSSLNTYGYSSHPLEQYISWIEQILLDKGAAGAGKPFIVSVTGSPEDVGRCYEMLLALRDRSQADIFMEINLSCPNIPGKSPPAYSADALREYLRRLQPLKASIPVGLKLPPYTYREQFESLLEAIRCESTALSGHTLVDFLTSTNTLGSCFVPQANGLNALASADGTGIGGMAGAALHPLALGNVKTLASMIRANPELREKVAVIGVGGVEDAESFSRMRAAGASVIGLGTALGREGVPIFGKIANSAGLSQR